MAAERERLRHGVVAGIEAGIFTIDIALAMYVVLVLRCQLQSFAKEPDGIVLNRFLGRIVVIKFEQHNYRRHVFVVRHRQQDVIVIHVTLTLIEPGTVGRFVPLPRCRQYHVGLAVVV